MTIAVDKIVEVISEGNEELGNRESNIEAEFDDFTPVVSRKSKKNMRKNSGGKKTNQGVPLSGTKSLRRASNNHPLCDIITSPRLRSHTVKNKKLLVS
jgi:hypothetical protein